MQVGLSSNIHQFTNNLKQYARDVPEKAVVRALNRTAEMARTDASRRIKDAGFNLNSSNIKRAINISKASRGKLTATLKVSRKVIPLVAYDARQTKAGVSVKVKGARKLIKGAFLATMPNGHTGVFVRAPGARAVSGGGIHGKKVGNSQFAKGSRKTSSALPIIQLFGPSIGGAIANRQVQEAMGKSIVENFKKRLKVEIERVQEEARRNRAAGKNYDYVY